MAYWRLHYHAVWSCKYRKPLIVPELEPALYDYLRNKGFKLGAIVHAIGGIADHIHVVYSLHPKFSVADFIGQLKGSSSHWVSKVLKHPGEFDWQSGYGVLSFSDRAMPKIIDYVNRQKQHHQKNTTIAPMEKWCEENDGVTSQTEAD